MLELSIYNILNENKGVGGKNMHKCLASKRFKKEIYEERTHVGQSHTPPPTVNDMTSHTRAAFYGMVRN